MGMVKVDRTLDVTWSYTTKEETDLAKGNDFTKVTQT